MARIDQDGAAALGAACVFSPSGVESGPPLCPFAVMTGLPCPGCGLTRSWVAFMHGDVGSAFTFNAFGPVFLVLTAVGFSLLGFIIGLWAKNFEQLQIIPLMVITPLVFLGGAFYSASMLPAPWDSIARFNPVLHLISGFRWSFFGLADVPVTVSLLAVAAMIVVCMGIIRWIFASGWRLRE